MYVISKFVGCIESSNIVGCLESSNIVGCIESSNIVGCIASKVAIYSTRVKCPFQLGVPIHIHSIKTFWL